MFWPLQRADIFIYFWRLKTVSKNRSSTWLINHKQITTERDLDHCQSVLKSGLLYFTPKIPLSLLLVVRTRMFTSIAKLLNHLS